MAAISETFGQGGSGTTGGGAGTPTLADVLRDIADDLGDRSGIAAADATDIGTNNTLTNEIKAALNNTVRTTKV